MSGRRRGPRTTDPGTAAEEVPPQRCRTVRLEIERPVLPATSPASAPAGAEMSIDVSAADAFLATRARLLDRRRSELLTGRAEPAACSRPWTPTAIGPRLRLRPQAGSALPGRSSEPRRCRLTSGTVDARPSTIFPNAPDRGPSLHVELVSHSCRLPRIALRFPDAYVAPSRGTYRRRRYATGAPPMVSEPTTPPNSARWKRPPLGPVRHCQTAEPAPSTTVRRSARRWTRRPARRRTARAEGHAGCTA